MPRPDLLTPPARSGQLVGPDGRTLLLEPAPEQELVPVPELLLAPDEQVVACTLCSRLLGEFESWNVHGLHYCQDCFSGLFFDCANCNSVHPLDEGREIGEDYFCRACACECAECGEYALVNSTVLINGRNVCQECSGSFRPCDCCGGYAHYDDIRPIDSGMYICTICARDGYEYCPECGTWYNDDYCPDCGGGSNASIHSYSYKPKPVFCRGAGEKDADCLYFGVELEVEASIRHGLHEAVEICEEADLPIYLKEDGSIEYGFEIVSHPCTLAYWHQVRPNTARMLEELESAGCDAEAQGMHVHISKAGMSDIHKIRFQTFFDSIPDILPDIARRGANRWAQYKKIAEPSLKNATHHPDRYMAVNWLPSRTVEIRCFRGTLDTNEYMASIEFCHAVYQFTKSQISIAQLVKGCGWEQFCKFIGKTARYAGLVKYLSERGIYSCAL